ncbi:MAG TPA: NAD(P)H-dependent oxidoreductase subunit E [Paludibaculum sp.]|jgi:NADH:ubiquinone oxidoreductase subunit E
MKGRAAGVVVLVCVAALTADYAVKIAWTAASDIRVAAMQEKVRADAGLAPGLAAEQKKIADFNRARRTRINWLSLVLIVAAAAFLVEQPKAPRRIPEKPQKAAGVRRGGGPVVTGAAAPAIDLAFVDDVVAREGRGPEAAIPILQAIQAHFRYLPDEALRRVCELTEITPAQIAGTSSFYSRFRRSPVGEHIVRVCHGTACHVAGARQITDELRRELKIAEGEDTDPSRTFTIEEVACLGCCSLAPVVMVGEHTAGNLTPATACDALGEHA